MNFLNLMFNVYFSVWRNFQLFLFYLKFQKPNYGYFFSAEVHAIVYSNRISDRYFNVLNLFKWKPNCSSLQLSCICSIILRLIRAHTNGPLKINQLSEVEPCSTCLRNKLISDERKHPHLAPFVQKQSSVKRSP